VSVYEAQYVGYQSGGERRVFLESLDIGGRGDFYFKATDMPLKLILTLHQ
jgi:hypothetical protein